VGNSPEKRNPMAEAMAWVSRITAISLQMVLPALAGHFLDKFFGTWFLVLLGAAVGMVLGFWQLLAIAKKSQDGRPPKQASEEDSPPKPWK
jgi:F0F1-type ATP synthase assembly protein I